MIGFVMVVVLCHVVFAIFGSSSGAIGGWFCFFRDSVGAIVDNVLSRVDEIAVGIVRYGRTGTQVVNGGGRYGLGTGVIVIVIAVQVHVQGVGVQVGIVTYVSAARVGRRVPFLVGVARARYESLFLFQLLKSLLLEHYLVYGAFARLFRGGRGRTSGSTGRGLCSVGRSPVRFDFFPVEPDTVFVYFIGDVVVFVSVRGRIGATRMFNVTVRVVFGATRRRGRRDWATVVGLVEIVVVHEIVVVFELEFVLFVHLFAVDVVVVVVGLLEYFFLVLLAGRGRRRRGR